MQRIVFVLFVALVLSSQCAPRALAQWHKEPVPGMNGNLHSLFFLSDQIGFVISCDPNQSSWSSNFLLQTVDGGKNWNYGPGSELCPFSVFFVNSSIGYFARRGSSIGAEGVVSTQNGGTTWAMADTTVGKASSFEASALCFVNDSVGFASVSGAINKTTNGGKSWTPVSYHFGGPISSIVFTSPQTGYAVGYDAALLLKTTNGGMSWNLVTNQYSLVSIYFSSPARGYAVGLNGTIIYTNDAGTTWNVPASTDGNLQTLRSVFCLNENTCFAVGDSGTILKTTDGGHTWTKQISGTTQKLTSVACPDNNTCFAAGDGILLKTTNSGETGVSFSEQTTRTHIYLDPSTSMVVIRLAAPVNDATLSVFNLFGQKISQKNNLMGDNITIDGLSSGLYFFTIQKGGRTMDTGKFLVE